MGFVHGESYMITSAFDGLVFDVKGQGRKDGAKLIGCPWNGGAHQIFTASSESGGFRLQASHVTDDIKVLDQSNGATRILLWAFHGGDNQLWNAFPTAENPDVFYIQNVSTGMAIRNNGLGKTLECTTFNPHDPNTLWRLTPTSLM